MGATDRRRPGRRIPRGIAAAAAAVALGAIAVAPGDGRNVPGRSPDVTVSAEPSAQGSTSPTVAPSATTTTLPREFTLVATGDVLLHQPLWEQALADAAAAGGAGHDFRPLLAGVAPHVAGADLAICHLETPVAEPGGPTAGYPAFNVPPEIVPALADTGYDACTTASNHTYDRGAAGVDRTLDALDAAGIRHAGSARHPDEAATTTEISVAGATVALLSYTFGFNGVPPPDGQTWRSNPIDEARILADAARARAEGASVVVVAMHWGDEYDPEPNAQQQALGPALVRSPDIDLVLGHHAHVVQPIEVVDGEWVVYGMGNMVARHGTPGAPNQEGLLVRFTFTEGPQGWRVTRAEFAALLVVLPGPPIRVVDVGAALATGTGPAGPVDGALRARLQLAWERTTGTVDRRGASTFGLRPLPGSAPPPADTP
ncbi:MAG TPA: CapA family protein [Acidimicrobiales bacterium]|nr:CapA family protein [Acidimicrobiales bacterium]